MDVKNDLTICICISGFGLRLSVSFYSNWSVRKYYRCIVDFFLKRSADVISNDTTEREGHDRFSTAPPF